MHPQPRAPASENMAACALVAAPCLPAVLALNVPPSPTLLNQCVAIAAWGAAIWSAADRHLVPHHRTPGIARPLDWTLAPVVVGLVLSWAMALPVSLFIGQLSVVLSTILVLRLGASCAAAPIRLFQSFLLGVLVAGIVNALIGFAQVFAPGVLDGDWFAKSAMVGRAVGNLRQPNHLSSLVLWSLIALVGLAQCRPVRRHWVVACVILLVGACVLSGSRTGAAGTLLLAAWGLSDRRLTKDFRVLLGSVPVLFAATWVLFGSMGSAGWIHFAGEERIATFSSADVSSSRFAIWANALTLIAREPIMGVGFGEFNLAWTLTALPTRPGEFFDHAHNLPLQLLAELGLGLGLLVMALLLYALVLAWRRACSFGGQVGCARRTAVVLVLMIGLHSMLEYPLWYAYFLLPTAFAWGYAISSSGRSEQEPTFAVQQLLEGRPRWPQLAAGLAMMFGAAAAVLDYRQVASIYDPPDSAAPLEDRIARGQRSPLFGHHADYAAATAFGPPTAPLSPSQELAFKRAPHQLLDVRLMIAWSQALAAQGDLDKARWLAARIREFRNPGADEYFAPCADPAQSAQAFQCQPPTREVHWREFVQR